MIDLLILSLCCFCADLPPREGTDEIGAAIKASLESNRALLMTRGTIRFRTASGTADDFESVRQGKWTSRHVANGLLVYDGERKRFDFIYDFAEALATRVIVDEYQTSSDLLSGRYLTDGRKTLVDQFTIPIANPGTHYQHQVYIDSQTYHFFRDLWLPLNLGREGNDDLSSHIDQARKHEPNLRLETAEISPDADQASLLFRFPQGTYKYTVDLARGAVPISRIDEFTIPDAYSRRTFWEDIRRLPNGAWLPHRLVFFRGDGYAIEVLIDETNFTKPPDPKLLCLQFDEPAGIQDRHSKMIYSKRKFWDLQELPRAGSKEAHPISSFIQPVGKPRQMPGELTPSNSLPQMMIVVGAFVMIVVSILVVRRKRNVLL